MINLNHYRTFGIFWSDRRAIKPIVHYFRPNPLWWLPAWLPETAKVCASSGRRFLPFDSRQAARLQRFLTYFALIRSRALTTSCGFCQESRQRSSNTFAYSPDDGG